AKYMPGFLKGDALSSVGPHFGRRLASRPFCLLPPRQNAGRLVFAPLTLRFRYFVSEKMQAGLLISLGLLLSL
ncbi:MAG: hypothetical protein K2H81_05820, partial [Alistipes sp.]|nr:hypothetical protein [Alistipes sp.]